MDTPVAKKTSSTGVSTADLNLTEEHLSVGAGKVVDPITGQPLSLDEAIRCGLIDPSTGEFVDPKTGQRISLQDAVVKGLVDPKLAETLAGNCGVFDPRTGQHLTLLEAIAKGLFDPKEKTFVDPKSGKPVSVNEAVRLGFILQEKVRELLDTMGPPKQSDSLTLISAVREGLVDIETGNVRDRKGSIVPLARAISSGYIDVEPASASGLSLADAIRQGIVQKGQVVDRNTGSKFSLSEAVERGLLNPEKNEIYDEGTKKKITLASALSSDVISGAGMYNANGTALTLEQAVKCHKIQNPMTLKECCDQQLVDDNNFFKNPVTSENCNMLEAIGIGFVDYELKSVRDVKAEVYISLGEALGKNIVKPDGKFVDSQTNESMSLADAVKKGFLTSVSQKSIFEIEGIKNPATGDYVSFNEALERGIIDKSNCTFLDKKTMTRMTLQEAADKDFIQKQLLEMLERPIGISVLGNELTLIQAVMNRRLDSMSGLLIDTSTKATVPLEAAVEKKLITAMGAANLKSLLNITVTTATVTQTVRRTIKVSSSTGEAEEGAITFQDALRRGLIDEKSGVFTDPETNKEIALDEAINLGMIKLGSASSTRKSSATSVRKTSNTSTASSRKSSNASSRSSSPPKSLGAAKEFIKESSSRDSRSSSLTTSIKMSSTQSESKNASQTSSRNGSVSASRRDSQSSNKSVSVQKNNSSRRASQTSEISSTRASSRTSTHSSLNGSRPGSPKKSPEKSPAKKSADDGEAKRLNRLDSFEARMEERSEIEAFAAESKMDYSYKSETGSPTLGTISSGRGTPSLPETKYEVPPDGFTLKIAIDDGLFDPSQGLFKIPGSDQATSFQECIELNIINAFSATVISEEQKYSLKRATETGILDSTGHLAQRDGVISMEEALRTGKILHESYREIDVQHQTHSVSSHETSSSSFQSSEKTEQISENIRYDKTSGTYEVNSNLHPSELMSALKEGKILPSDIKVDDPSSGTKLNMMEAMSKGLIDRSTGEYTGGETKMNILQALKVGAVALVGAPIALAAAPAVAGKMAYDKIKSARESRRDEREQEVMGVERDTLRGGTIHARIVESGVTTTRISSFTVEVPSTGEEISLEEAVKRGLVSEETAKQYREEVTTDKTVESMVLLILDPSTGEEIPAEEAIARGIVTKEEVEEFMLMKQGRSKLTSQGSLTSLPSTRPSRGGSPNRPQSPSSRSSSRMTQQQRDTDREQAASRMTAVSSSSVSRASSADSFIGDEDKSSASRYSSTLTVDVNKTREVVREVESSSSASHTVQTKIVNLKQGYALSSLDEVRNLQTGETMSIYEAKLRGIASDVQGNKEEIVTKQVQIFVSEAISRNLINFSSGVFTNPMSGQTVSIAEAVKSGLLITDFKEQAEETFIDLDGDKISAGDAFVHLFDVEQKTFLRKTHNRSYTLQEAVDENWINGEDIIFDVTSSSNITIRKAMETHILHGVTCEYTIKETNQTLFIGDAAKQGLVAIFPEAAFEEKKKKYVGRVYTMREAIDEGIYQIDTGLFFVMQTEEHVTISEALSMGMIDHTSAEVKNTSTGMFLNLNRSLHTRTLHHTTCKVLDLAQHTELNLLEAYERGLMRDVVKSPEKSSSPFDSTNFWDAIEMGQLDIETGLYTSEHEEGKKLKLEEAIFRKYICKKSAFVIDTWKRKFCSLSEATRKNIIKDGMVMNTTIGKFLSVKEAIEQKIIVKDVTKLSLIEILDFGLYQPYSGKIFVPGSEIEISLSEAIDCQIIDHKKTIVKNQKSGRFISTMEALHLGDINGISGMYGSINLLEARSRGYLLPIDAMVRVLYHLLVSQFLLFVCKNFDFSMITSLLSIENSSNCLDVSSRNIYFILHLIYILRANPHEDSDYRNGERLTPRKIQLHGMTN